MGIIHGAEQTRKVPVNLGAQKSTKREKYCIIHGWVDVFAIGGDIAWHRQHSKCGSNEHGAFLALKKAA